MARDHGTARLLSQDDMLYVSRYVYCFLVFEDVCEKTVYVRTERWGDDMERGIRRRIGRRIEDRGYRIEDGKVGTKNISG